MRPGSRSQSYQHMSGRAMLGTKRVFLAARVTRLQPCPADSQRAEISVTFGDGRFWQWCFRTSTSTQPMDCSGSVAVVNLGGRPVLFQVSPHGDLVHEMGLDCAGGWWRVGKKIMVERSLLVGVGLRSDNL